MTVAKLDVLCMKQAISGYTSQLDTDPLCDCVPWAESIANRIGPVETATSRQPFEKPLTDLYRPLTNL